MLVKYLLDENKLSSFLNGVIEDDRFASEDPKILDGLKQELNRALENQALDLVLAELEPDQASYLGRLVSTKEAVHKVQEYLLNTIPDIGERVTQLLRSFESYWLSCGIER